MTDTERLPGSSESAVSTSLDAVPPTTSGSPRCEVTVMVPSAPIVAFARSDAFRSPSSLSRWSSSAFGCPLFPLASSIRRLIAASPSIAWLAVATSLCMRPSAESRSSSSWPSSLEARFAKVSARVSTVERAAGSEGRAVTSVKAVTSSSKDAPRPLSGSPNSVSSRSSAPLRAESCAAADRLVADSRTRNSS